MDKSQCFFRNYKKIQLSLFFDTIIMQKGMNIPRQLQFKKQILEVDETKQLLWGAKKEFTTTK